MATGHSVVIRKNDEERAQLTLEFSADCLHDAGEVLLGELDRQPRDGFDEVEGENSGVFGSLGRRKAHQRPRFEVDNLGLGSRVRGLPIGCQDLHNLNAHTRGMGETNSN